MNYNTIIENTYIPLDETNFEPTRTWLSNFENLQLFLNNKRWNDLREDKHLYMWATLQRKRFNNKTLSLTEFEKLKSIGFIWDLSMYKWDETYLALANYYRINDGQEPLYDRKNPN